MYSDNELPVECVSSLSCIKCSSRAFLLNQILEQRNKCDGCNNIEGVIGIVCKKCYLEQSICINCHLRKKTERTTLGTVTEKENEKVTSSWFWYVGAAAVVLISLYFALSPFLKSKEENINLIETLRKEFPSQENGTWYDFLYMLDKKIISVKSILFLHSKDLNTSMCLTKKLVYLYNEMLDLEEITFSPAEYETKDYGYALKHYHEIVKKFRVFVTDLNSVPGNIARIFHSLCDEVSSDLKPSLFIFTLQYNEISEKLKPIQRATDTLKKVWSNLPESELFPLLSRVVKKTVDVIPEKEMKC